MVSLYSNMVRDSNIEIVFEYRARFEFQISDFWWRSNFIANYFYFLKIIADY